MIRLVVQDLSAEAIDNLDTWQDEVDDKPTFPEKVSEAKRLWKLKNRRNNATFKEVRSVLTQMCSGVRRCCYCEDSMADEVEHIHPKDIYPEMAFKWDNYLYACGPCNGPKNNKFAVFRQQDGEFEEVTPSRQNPNPTPPAPGDPVLVTPRSEDPMNYLMLDIMDSFFFSELPVEDTRAYKRAKYSIELLQLNGRDLPDARENAFENYVSRLSRYVTRRDAGANRAELDNLIRGIKKEAHPTVWAEMKRYFRDFNQAMQQQLPELWNLFEQAPEALNW